MALTINTNIPSLRVDRQISKKSSDLNKNFEALSSGKRINRASDDPAGLSIALQLLSNSQVSDVAQRNISDAVSAANIADGSVETASGIATRLQELATQSANGTLSDEQRESLSSEFNALRSELDRISSTTQFNGQNLLDGSTSFTIQAGTDGSANSQISIPFPGVSSSGLGLSANIDTQQGARDALTQTKAAVDSLSRSRGDIGATVSRLDVANENLRASSVNERDAASQIYDADIAQEAAKLTANRIGQQAALAVKAQANILPQLALKLLQ